MVQFIMAHAAILAELAQAVLKLLMVLVPSLASSVIVAAIMAELKSLMVAPVVSA